MTTLRGLDHIAIAVRNTDDALEFFSARLGLLVIHAEENLPARARLTYLDAGNLLIQLVEPLSEDTPLARDLDRDGEGLHHICFRVPDVERAARQLASDPAAQVRLGSGRGRPSAFVPGAAEHGVRLEVTEAARPDTP